MSADLNFYVLNTSKQTKNGLFTAKLIFMSYVFFEIQCISLFKNTLFRFIAFKLVRSYFIAWRNESMETLIKSVTLTLYILNRFFFTPFFLILTDILYIYIKFDVGFYYRELQKTYCVQTISLHDHLEGIAITFLLQNNRFLSVTTNPRSPSRFKAHCLYQIKKNRPQFLYIVI